MTIALAQYAVVASFLALSVQAGIEKDPKVFGARKYNYIVVGGTECQFQLVDIGSSYVGCNRWYRWSSRRCKVTSIVRVFACMSFLLKFFRGYPDSPKTLRKLLVSLKLANIFPTILLSTLPVSIPAHRSLTTLANA